MDMNKKLYRSRNDKMVSGVCAGIANYLNIDPHAGARDLCGAFRVHSIRALLNPLYRACDRDSTGADGGGLSLDAVD